MCPPLSDAPQPNASPGIQQPLPLAFVHGKALIEKPEDLYIPPDALEVILESFEGPLDLLLYLIRRQKFDILTLPVLQITRQYMEYVDLMLELKLELAAEYLLMAAILAEIKSRLLLPRRPDAEPEEDDPRAELIRRLQEYEQIKKAAADIDALPRLERDVYTAAANTSENVTPIRILPSVTLQELVLSFQEVLTRAAAFEHHHVKKEALSTRERMSRILDTLRGREFVPFPALFTVEEGRAGVVVTFLALLELVKEALVVLVQTEAYGPVHVRASVTERD